MSIISQKQFNIDFMKWLIKNSISPSISNKIKVEAGYDNNTVSPIVCDITLDLLGHIPIENVSGQESSINSFLPSNDILYSDIDNIPSVSNNGETPGKFSAPNWIQLEQKNMRNASPLKLSWVNGAVNSTGASGPIDYNFDTKLYVGGKRLEWGVTVGPSVISKLAQFIFAIDAEENIWLVGGAYDAYSENPTKTVFFGDDGSSVISSYKLTSGTPIPDNTFDFDIDWNSIDKTFLNIFIETNPKYSNAVCLNNQILGGFWNFSDCSGRYFRDNEDIPNDNCSLLISQYCNGEGKTTDPSLCGCYTDEIPENLKGIVCDAPDSSGNVDTTDCVPRECILPSCMNGSAFKTKDQLQNNDCHKICSGGYLPLLEKGGQFNNKGSEIKLYCGGKTITFGQGGPNIKPTPSKDPNIPLILSISILAVILIVLIIIFILI